MHILETYSLLSGAKIGSCHIDLESMQLPESKYITFHPECQKASARQYNHWSIVIDLLKKTKGFTEKYKIAQVGSITDKRHDVDYHYLGTTNTQQLAYIIKHSELHLGYDSFPMHLASHFDKKMVVLFAYYAKSSGPYFSSSHNAIVLEPDYSRFKPSFSYTDPNNLINSIDPNIVYKNILQLLNIDHE